MANQYVNKVSVNGINIIDISQDTVTSDKLLSGTTAHSKSGAPITGTIANKGAFVDQIHGYADEIYGEEGYYSSIHVDVNPGEDFNENNIRAGKVILGLRGNLVPGTDVSDTTATTSTVKSGETFYDATGTKQTGAMPEAQFLVDNVVNTGQTILPRTTQRVLNFTAGYMPERTVNIYPVTQSGLEAANIVNGKVVQVKANTANIFNVTGTGTYYDYFREQKTASSRRSMYGATSTSSSNRYYVSYTSPSDFRATTVMYMVVTGSIYKWGIINFDGSYNGGTACAYCCDATHQQLFTTATQKNSFVSSSGWNSAGYLNPGATVYMPVDTNGAVVNYIVTGYHV